MQRKLLFVALGVAAIALGLVAADRMLFGFSGPLAAVQRTLAGSSTAAAVGWSVVGRDFGGVTDIQFVPGSTRRALVLLKDGSAHVVSFAPGQVVTRAGSPEVLRVQVRSNSELGLLGLAFHPKYLQNGLFYLNYNPAAGATRTRIAEWQLDNRRLGHEQAVERRVILEVDQPYDNHNAGQLAFGPDGMLYVGLGDGGSRADPLKVGQDLGKLLGKMLRVDVDEPSAQPYAVPPDNPFVGRSGARPEIWAYGLRNPWRYAFDAQGRLIVADVGQDEFEEVDIVERGDNLGWAVREGRHCFPPGATCKAEGFKEPVFEYPRRDGKSITGGTVYQGRALPFLAGKYLCADYVSGNVWALELPSASTGDAKAVLLGRFPHAITTFGRDADGEVYAGDFASGELLKLAPGGRS